MSTFVTKLEKAAEEAMAHPHVPPVRVAPDPPHHLGGAAPVPLTYSAGLPVVVRTMVDHAALERALQKVGATVPAGGSAQLVALAEEMLDGRSLDGLAAAARKEIATALRDKLVRMAPGTAKRQRDLVAEAKALFSAKNSSAVLVATADAWGGTWVYFHDGSPTAPVIWGEAFVPHRPGTRVPSERPDLKMGGLSGTPTWRTASGKFVSKPPALPTKPVVVPSGLDPQALAQAPEAVLDEMARAQRAACEAAEQQSRPITLISAAPGTRRAGSRIFSIEEKYPSQPGGTWDKCTVAEGVTGPETIRMSETEMDRVLPRIGLLTDDPELLGMARMHLFGPIFGDETLAGLAYGPHGAANLLASGYAEGFARFDARRAGRINVKAGTPVRVSQYVKYRTIKGQGRYPFVVSVKYEYTLESGARVAAVIDISPTGIVTFHVEGAGQVRIPR